MLKYYQIFLVAIILLPINNYGQESGNEWDYSRPDSHAPLDIMGDHIHHKGEWMVSYRYMDMTMNKHFVDDNEISTEDILDQYMVVPLNMDMHMHMVGAMFAPGDKLTLMLMTGLQNQSMDHMMRNGAVFTTNSSSISDTKIMAIIDLWSRNGKKLLFNAGISLPTGKNDLKDDTPMGEDLKLPYPMQVGSGTFDWYPGFTYIWQRTNISGGLRAKGVLRTGKNNQGYAFGDQLNLSSWFAYRWNRYVSSSVGLESSWISAISGADEMLNPMMVQTADPTNFGGYQVMGSLGINVVMPFPAISRLRTGIVYEFPLYLNLNGPQLAINSNIVIGLQYSF